MAAILNFLANFFCGSSLSVFTGCLDFTEGLDEVNMHSVCIGDGDRAPRRWWSLRLEDVIGPLSASL